MWLFFAILSAVFAGVTAILAKVGIKKVESNLATALRTIVVLIFAWMMVFVNGSQSGIRELETGSVVFLVLSGFATGASWLCYFKALQVGDVNKVTPIDKSSTILTMLLAFLLLKEPISPLKLVCILLIGVGTYLMLLKKKSEETTSFKTSKSWILYALFSAFFASLTSILGKIGIEGVESSLGTAIRTIVVLIMAWIVVFISRQQNKIKSIDKKSALFLTLSGITTGLSWLCYYRALQDGLASVVVPIDKLSILLTTFFSVVILKEKISMKAIFGLAFITIGTLLLLV